MSSIVFFLRAGLCAFFACALLNAAPAEMPAPVHLRAGDTLRAVELEPGASLVFTLKDGSARTFTLLTTSARVLWSNLKTPKRSQGDGATVYEMTASILADGEPLTLRRYVGTQASFYEPYVVNGVRLWFDAVSDIGAFLNLNHGDCKPAHGARFALQEASARICPDAVYLWFDTPLPTLDVARCYAGRDVWMGAFMGADAHGGLDVEQRAGTVNFTPIAVDDQYLFESLARGDDNNRWRGVRRWPDGDTWTLQAHHLMSVFYPEHVPIRAGAAFCTAAGIKYGAYEHTHYVFKIRPKGASQDIQLDPWILFWQAFLDRADRAGAIRAQMAPVQPSTALGQVSFRAEGSRAGPGQTLQSYVWTFGDGGVGFGPQVSHTFLKPGVYPVTLTVYDGAHMASTTQHLTMQRGSLPVLPALVLRAEDELSFAVRPPEAMDTYAVPASMLPHTLAFTARANTPAPRAREIRIQSASGAPLAPAQITVEAIGPDGSKSPAPAWLKTELSQQDMMGQFLSVRVEASGLAPALYRARVWVNTPGALNSPQGFNVDLLVPAHPALPPRSKRVQIPREKIVDNEGSEFFASPYFWFAPPFRDLPQGFGGSYLTSGAMSAPGQYARFAPDLRAGRYQVSFADETPFSQDARFTVRVRHAGGFSNVSVQPSVSRDIGVFTFADGTDGWVDILIEGSAGQVIADAVIFRRLD